MKTPEAGHRIALARAAIARIISDRPLSAAALSDIMTDAFGGTDAAGRWEWREAYDLMQLAATDILAVMARRRDPHEALVAWTDRLTAAA